jgi:hypothetical protein
MSSMAIRRYKSVNVTTCKEGYRKPFAITIPILDYRNGHYVRPNMVVFKCHDFKKDVDPNVHVKMFNFVIKVNVETFEKYIINVFNYMLRNTTLNWWHNYMSDFLYCIFLELT